MDGQPPAPRRDGPAELEWLGVLAPLGVDAAITTRHGGVSAGPYRSLNLAFHVGDDPAAVAENRRRAATAFGCGPRALVCAEQVHGTAVAVVGAAEQGRGAFSLGDALAGVDALVTAEAGPVLVTMVADCLPLALVDPVAGVLATVHAGWRGTVGGVVGAALDTMASLGAETARITAVLGPCVGADRYQVGPEVADAVAGLLGRRAATVLSDDGPGHWRLDLAGANRLVLAERGVDPDRVHQVPAVTGLDGPYFSDRTARPCGRNALLARLRP